MIARSSSAPTAIAIDEAGLIRQDVSRNLIVSLVAVSALYWLCYRRFAALLYSTIPLLVGQALTFGLAYFALRSLNASSSAFTALLMGLDDNPHGIVLGAAAPEPGPQEGQWIVPVEVEIPLASLVLVEDGDVLVSDARLFGVSARSVSPSCAKARLA